MTQLRKKPSTSRNIIERLDDSYDGYLLTFSMQPMRPSALWNAQDEISWRIGEWHQQAVVESIYTPLRSNPPRTWYAYSDDTAAKRRAKPLPARSKRKQQRVLFLMQLPPTAKLRELLEDMLFDCWLPVLQGKVQQAELERLGPHALSPTRTGFGVPGADGHLDWNGMLFHPLECLGSRDEDVA